MWCTWAAWANCAEWQRRTGKQVQAQARQRSAGLAAARAIASARARALASQQLLALPHPLALMLSRLPLRRMLRMPRRLLPAQHREQAPARPAQPGGSRRPKRSLPMFECLSSEDRLFKNTCVRCKTNTTSPLHTAECTWSAGRLASGGQSSAQEATELKSKLVQRVTPLELTAAMVSPSSDALSACAWPHSVSRVHTCQRRTEVTEIRFVARMIDCNKRVSNLAKLVRGIVDRERGRAAVLVVRPGAKNQ